MLQPYQKKLTIFCAVVLAVLGMLYGTVYVLCKIYLEPVKIKEMLIAQAKNRFDRTISVGDDIELIVDWDMSPNIILHKFTLSNSTWASHPYIFTADTIEFNFTLLDLLFKKLNINMIKLEKPQLFLEVHGKQSNIEDLKRDTNSPGETSISMNIHKVGIIDGLVVYNLDKVTLDKFNLTIHDSSQDYHLVSQGKHNDLPFKTNIEVKKMNTYFKLNIAHLELGSSDLTGDFAIEYDPVRITGEFKSNKFVLDEFMAQNPNTTGEYSVPNTALPVATLLGSKFDVTASFKTLIVSGLKFRDVVIKTKNEKNVLDFSLSPPAKIVSGTLGLNLNYDLNPKTPVLSLKAQTHGIKLEDVTKELFNKAPITGSSLDVVVNVSGQGSDMDSVVNTLKGQILIKAGAGQFQNSVASIGDIFTSVLTSVLTFDKGASTSAFKCGVMNFKVHNGVATAKQGIGIEAANVNVLGNGSVDLRNGRIAFSMVPQTISVNPIDIANFSVAQLVEIKGTLSKPVMSLNPTNLLTQGTGALVAAGISGGLTGGIGSILASAGLLGKNNKSADFSPCQAALNN